VHVCREHREQQKHHPAPRPRRETGNEQPQRSGHLGQSSQGDEQLRSRRR
jgi:hypothetical protein